MICPSHIKSSSDYGETTFVMTLALSTKFGHTVLSTVLSDLWEKRVFGVELTMHEKT